MVRVLSSSVARVIFANPLPVKSIAHARIKTDKINASVRASLQAARLSAWSLAVETERLRRLMAQRNQVIRHWTKH